MARRPRWRRSIAAGVAVGALLALAPGASAQLPATPSVPDVVKAVPEPATQAAAPPETPEPAAAPEPEPVAAPSLSRSRRRA